jgi:hypothetical protein
MTNILDTVEPDSIADGFDRDVPLYSRETVESLLEAHRKQVLLEAAERRVWVVYHTEEHVGSFVQGLFSSEEKAQSWIDTQSNWPKDECFISVMELDDELRLIAEGEK